MKKRKEKTNLALERVEKGRKEIEHPSVNHHRLLPFVAPTRRKQRHATDAIQRCQGSPARVRPAGHLDAGESNIHGGVDSLHHETAEGGGGGVGLTAQPPRLRQQRRRHHKRCQHLAALKPIPRKN